MQQNIYFFYKKDAGFAREQTYSFHAPEIFTFSYNQKEGKIQLNIIKTRQVS